MSIYGITPTFTNGQILSASNHLNALQQYVQALHDDFAGVQMPFGGSCFMQDRVSQYDWRGIIRHKTNSFSYCYQIIDGSDTVRIYINDVEIVAARHSGAGVYTATGVDISSLALTIGEFYTILCVQDDYNTHIKVFLLAEDGEDLSALPTLQSFADETTPTAAHWQDLSDYALALAERSQSNNAAVPAIYDETVYLRVNTPLCGTLNHRAEYLAYSFLLWVPYWGADSEHPLDLPIWPYNFGEPWPSVNTGARWNEAQLYIDGSPVARWRVGNVAPETGTWYSEWYNEDNALANHTFSGILHLPTYAPALVIGDDYKIEIRCFDSSFWGGGAVSQVNYAYETPNVPASLLGWTGMEYWVHGDWVYGSTQAALPDMQELVDNLELLGTTTQYRNNAARHYYEYKSVRDLYCVRRWRWLHYRNPVKVEEVKDSNGVIITPGVDPKPTLTFTYRGKVENVSLPDASTDWLAYDLDSVQGLFPGTPYRLSGLVLYAMEDVTA